jgi:hypothetical protein
MSHVKLGLLGLCAVVVGMMAVSASAAQGATLSWLVLNAAKTSASNLKAELAAKPDTEHVVLSGKVGASPIAVTCTGSTLKEVFIEPVEKLNEGGKAIFTGCKVYKESLLVNLYNCTVKTPGTAAGTVETNGLKGLLELVGGQVLTKIEPAAGGVFAAIKFEGAECPLLESNQLQGVIYLKDCQNLATTHLAEHLVESEPVNTKLYFGAHSAEQLTLTKLSGSIFIKLAGAHSNLDWAAMDV